jgi:oligoendopeptidase F
MDINTLLHEGGHAFHMFESLKWPTHQQSSLNNVPIEFVEVPSMAMELLAAPYLATDQGGFYSAKEAARALIENMEVSLGFWPYMAVVDAFQHWVYESPVEAHDLDQCNQTWSKIHQRFLPHLDWSGIEDTLEVAWFIQGHIFHDPFYYVEYGLAQLGAFQVWANARKDQEKAVQDYRKALALGNTASLSDLFFTAGAKFSFDVDTLKQAVDLIESAVEELSDHL